MSIIKGIDAVGHDGHKMQPERQGALMRKMGFALAAMLPVFAGGCVKLEAPDKPIEINLNVNIRQEVVIRLEKDVQDLIKNNPGVF